MNIILSGSVLGLISFVILLSPDKGPPALALCLIIALPILLFVLKMHNGTFLAQVFIFALVIRVALGTILFIFDLRSFFGPDAFTYDEVGYNLLGYWQGHILLNPLGGHNAFTNQGMYYFVAIIYAVIGRNMLAVQFVNAVLGATIVPIIFSCSHFIFQNQRVGRIAALATAFFPSMVLWTSLGLKDALIIFLLTLILLIVLKIEYRFNVIYVFVLIFALAGLFSLRFYIFYMVVSTVVGTFLIRSRNLSVKRFFQQAAVILVIGVSLTYLGILRTAMAQADAFGSLEAVQRSRSALVRTANSGFGKDIDVSTTAGAISAIPTGIVYLLLAPFPWQLNSLRQLITLPEMIIWWCSLPFFIIGLRYAVKNRLSQAIPIMLFTFMLTIAYSIYQGNVGTAYRQRAQLLVFYFIFIAVGIVFLKEKKENRRLIKTVCNRAEIVNRSVSQV